MKLLAQRHARVQRLAPLLEWNRWFAWYPVPVVIDGKLHYRGCNLSNESGVRADTAAQLNGAIGYALGHVRDRSPNQRAFRLCTRESTRPHNGSCALSLGVGDRRRVKP
jgi:hypothetical protein